MSEQLPAPDFDAQHYARPNQNWICGHACEGHPCRLGPDKHGHCRATAECQPALETKPGETKGRWRCTRPGGACESGPLPDGSCCRPIAKCSPIPSLRLWRGRITIAVVAAACAALLILIGNPPWRNKFISPGEVSRSHSGEAFAALAKAHGLNQNCGACHVAGSSGPNGMVNAALNASPGFFEFHKFLSVPAGEVKAIDTFCVQCHSGHAFHQPNTEQVSCSFCHEEHRGAMMTTTDAHCGFCHSDVVKMTSAALRGTHLPAAVFSPQRPPRGFTEVIHDFAGDHPQFRFLMEKQRDPDTLKFNHALHLTGETIPNLPNGAKLNCAFCHQPDASGAFMRPVNFENNCRVCHSLQFDPETPELQLPHGSVEFVSAFLRSLPKQYANLATESGEADANAFAREKLAGLREQFGSGEELERRIFFSTAKFGPGTEIGTVSGGMKPLYPGCAYCHEVKSSPSGAPEIIPPIIPEHWLKMAKFNHAMHANIACAQCHDAAHSRVTADILLPAKETCAACHSPRGGVASSCAVCHLYHKPEVAVR